MKRVLSTSFVLLVICTVSLALWIRWNALGSYRVMVDDLAPKVMKGDFLLVPFWSFVNKLPVEISPLNIGEILVVRLPSTKSLAKVVGMQGDKLLVAVGSEQKVVSEVDVVGRVWKIWFSVSRPGRVGSTVRWERVLLNIN